MLQGFKIPLCITLFIHFLCLFYFPSLKINFFIALFVYTWFYLPQHFYQCIIIIGLTLDLLTTNFFWGSNTLVWMISAFIMTKFKKFFIQDTNLIIPLWIFYSSVMLTLSELLLKIITGSAIHLSLKWVWTDLIIMPSVDMLYGVFLFIPLIKFMRTKKTITHNDRPQ